MSNKEYYILKADYNKRYKPKEKSHDKYVKTAKEKYKKLITRKNLLQDLVYCDEDGKCHREYDEREY